LPSPGTFLRFVTVFNTLSISLSIAAEEGAKGHSVGVKIDPADDECPVDSQNRFVEGEIQYV
jgi:hypothetical protein